MLAKFRYERTRPRSSKGRIIGAPGVPQIPLFVQAIGRRAAPAHASRPPPGGATLCHRAPESKDESQEEMTSPPLARKRMVSRDQSLQALVQNMGVDLRGRDVGMA